MNHQARAISFFLTVLGGTLFAPTARATDHSTAECLAASEASFKSDSERRLRAELSDLLVCAASTCPSDIRIECLRRVDEVKAAIPTVIFTVKDEAGNDLRAVKVIMDGALLADPLQGNALSIDPGEHSFVFETAGRSLTKTFVIREAQKDRRESISFGKVVAAAPPTAEPVRGGLGSQRIVGLVAGGIGVIGMGVGTAFAFVTMSKKSEAERVCPHLCSDASGVTSWSEAVRAGRISTAMFIVGGVGLAGAAALWWTAKPVAGPLHTEVSVGPGTLQLKGTW